MTLRATPTGVQADHVVVPWPSEDHPVSRLSFDNGIEDVEMHGDSGIVELLDATFADPVPVVRTVANDVHIEYPLGSRFLRRGGGASRLRMNPSANWSIEIHGGAANVDADLTRLNVQAITFHAGAADCRLALPRPAGECILRSKSLRNLRVIRPRDVPVRIEATKGVTKVTVDGRSYGAIGGGLVDETPRFGAAVDRYVLAITGGVTGLTVETAPVVGGSTPPQAPSVG